MLPSISPINLLGFNSAATDGRRCGSENLLTKISSDKASGEGEGVGGQILSQ